MPIRSPSLLAYLLFVVLLVTLASCTQQDETAEAAKVAVQHATSFDGNGARDGPGYFFGSRGPNTLIVRFSEPYLFPPSVNLTNPSLKYEAINISEWSFVLVLKGQGFWKDATFSVTGNKAGATRFCRDGDGGNNSFFGGQVYSWKGVEQDSCSPDDYRILEEKYCDGTTVKTMYVECEYNCYDQRGAAFCVNDQNVKEPCDDQFTGTDFFTKDFVNFNGKRMYDFCHEQIHGTRKELTEYACDGEELTQVNHFCTYGCDEGRCLHEDEFSDPEDFVVAFYALANSSQVDESIQFVATATDPKGVQALYFSEMTSTQTTPLTWESCESKTFCNATWKISRDMGGLRLFNLVAINHHNLSISKNLTLNFSGDPDAPDIVFNVSPLRNDLGNFTTLRANVTDYRGVNYLAIYQQVGEAKWFLLESVECEGKNSCDLSFRYNSSYGGDVRYILKTEDINGNVAFDFASVYYREPNATRDTTPPRANLSTEVTESLTGELVLFTYTVTDEHIRSVRFYKQEPDFPLSFISSFDCGNDILECAGEFTYKNSVPGKVKYMLNVSDANGNFMESNVTVLYKGESPDSLKDTEGPIITIDVFIEPKGDVNYTQIEYSATDNGSVTYMNLYEKKPSGYELLRTKFCFRQEECSGTFARQTQGTNVTYLVAAADIYGNRGEKEEVFVES